MMTLSQPAFGQCYPDRHSTNFFDGWISCEVAENPNPDRGKGHFIMYDFGKVFSLGEMQIWNTNDPAHLDWGMKDVAIDYSTDSVTWEHAGDFTFSQASGLSIYEGEEGPDLGGIEARFLLITGISNYGGTCYGLSEIKIEGTEVVVTDVEDVTSFECIDVGIYPNPFADKITLSISPACEGDLKYAIFDGLGKEIVSEKISIYSGTERSFSFGSNIPSGSYILQLEFGGQTIQKSIIKVNRT